MDKKIVVSLFQSYELANATADRLAATGFSHEDISVISQDSSAPPRSWSPATYTAAGTTGPAYGIAGSAYAPGAAYAPLIAGAPGDAAVPLAVMMPPVAGALGAGGAGTPAGSTSYGSLTGAAADIGDIADWLSGEGVDEDDAHAYAEGVRRGGSLLAVKCDEAAADRVVSIINNDGALDIDERQSAWRTEGWRSRDDTSGDRLDAGTEASSEEQVNPIVEEELHVGKRQVDHGRVRIHSHVSERPVQEQVSLPQEHVQVSRRPSDRRD